MILVNWRLQSADWTADNRLDRPWAADFGRSPLRSCFATCNSALCSAAPLRSFFWLPLTAPLTWFFGRFRSAFRSRALVNTAPDSWVQLMTVVLSPTLVSDDYAPQSAGHASLPGPTRPLVTELLQLPVPGYRTVYRHISEMMTYTL